MSYSYLNEKPGLMTEAGVRSIVKTLLHVQAVLKVSDVITMATAQRAADLSSGWAQMACVDYLVEFGYLLEVRQAHEPAGQDRIFRQGRSTA